MPETAAAEGATDAPDPGEARRERRALRAAAACALFDGLVGLTGLVLGPIAWIFIVPFVEYGAELLAAFAGLIGGGSVGLLAGALGTWTGLLGDRSRIPGGLAMSARWGLVAGFPSTMWLFWLGVYIVGGRSFYGYELLAVQASLVLSLPLMAAGASRLARWQWGPVYLASLPRPPGDRSVWGLRRAGVGASAVVASLALAAFLWPGGGSLCGDRREIRGKSVDGWIRELRRREDRPDAWRALVEAGAPAVTALDAALAEERGLRWRIGVEWYGWLFGLGRWVAPLIGQVGMSCPVREDAAVVFGRLGDASRADLPALVELTKKGFPPWSSVAVRALLDLCPTSRRAAFALLNHVTNFAGGGEWRGVLTARDVPRATREAWHRRLRTFLEEPSAELRARAAWTLLQEFPDGVESGEWLATLLEGAGSPRDALRRLAVGLLGSLGQRGRAALPTLLGALPERLAARDTRDATLILGTLARIGDLPVEAAEPIRQALRHGSPSVRSSAAWCASRLGAAPRPVTDELTLLLSENNDGIRLDAAVALVKLVASKAALDEVTQRLASANPWTCRNALQALGRCGPAAAAAVPEIEPLLSHSDAGVRRASAEALVKIRGR